MTSRYWIPLLEYSQEKNKIIWSGKSIPLPLKKYRIKKMSIKEGFGLINSTFLEDGNGLFVEDKNNKLFLLGIHNIFKEGKFSSFDNFSEKERKSEGNFNEENMQITLKTLINKKITTDYYKPNKTGIQISISGRLGGANKASRMAISTGSFRPQSYDSKLDYSGSKMIYTKWGTIGLKVNLT